MKNGKLLERCGNPRPAAHRSDGPALTIRAGGSQLSCTSGKIENYLTPALLSAVLSNQQINKSTNQQINLQCKN